MSPCTATIAARLFPCSAVRDFFHSCAADVLQVRLRGRGMTLVCPTAQAGGGVGWCCGLLLLGRGVLSRPDRAGQQGQVRALLQIQAHGCWLLRRLKRIRCARRRLPVQAAFNLNEAARVTCLCSRLAHPSWLCRWTFSGFEEHIREPGRYRLRVLVSEGPAADPTVPDEAPRDPSKPPARPNMSALFLLDRSCDRANMYGDYFTALEHSFVVRERSSYRNQPISRGATTHM